MREIQTLNDLKHIDVEAIVAAVIADDPDAEAIRDSLTRSLQQAKSGQFSRITKVAVSPIVETRHKVGLSQSQFAQTIGISVNTLKSWEQGQRKPSGAAEALLEILGKHPELVAELT
jgi:putative transcriptional regulator